MKFLKYLFIVIAMVILVVYGVAFILIPTWIKEK